MKGEGRGGGGEGRGGEGREGEGRGGEGRGGGVEGRGRGRGGGCGVCPDIRSLHVKITTVPICSHQEEELGMGRREEDRGKMRKRYTQYTT